jgi:hypothetical protein
LDEKWYKFGTCYTKFPDFEHSINTTSFIFL